MVGDDQHGGEGTGTGRPLMTPPKRKAASEDVIVMSPYRGDNGFHLGLNPRAGSGHREGLDGVRLRFSLQSFSWSRGGAASPPLTAGRERGGASRELPVPTERRGQVPGGELPPEPICHAPLEQELVESRQSRHMRWMGYGVVTSSGSCDHIFSKSLGS
jgi:hypothetical protein